MADTSELRQRKPAPANEEEPRRARAKARADEEDQYTPWVDVLRVLTFLFVASCALSYLISSGESLFWGMQHKPHYLRLNWWKNYFEPPIELTPEELANYDGTDPTKPIYLAINGTIYDVTPGARIYGPGGSYHWFAGCDASRAYVTGCFAEDRTPDMRGVEEMFLPLEDSEANSHFTKEELAELRKEEMRVARKKVKDALAHWVQFFEKHDKYRRVGTVKREKGWLKELPRKELCEAAQKGRKPRQIPEGRGEKG
ncbi:hypothetical protein VUR80DRAFT_1090 [Thermomyces stellatus]